MTKRSPNRLPEKYYRRRRAAAVVVIVLVVVLLIWLLTSIGGGSGDADQQDTGTDTATAAAEQTTSIAAPTSPSATDTTTASTTAEEKETVKASDEEESPYPDAPGSETAEPTTRVDEKRTSCELSDLVITASSDQATYPAEAQPTFYMTVANPTAADCDIDLDEETLRFEAYDLATNERIWSDTDCFDPVESGEQTFEAGSERYFEAVWSRRASAPGRCDARPAVPGGSYFLHAVIGTNPSPAHTFNLA